MKKISILLFAFVAIAFSLPFNGCSKDDVETNIVHENSFEKYVKSQKLPDGRFIFEDKKMIFSKGTLIFGKSTYDTLPALPKIQDDDGNWVDDEYQIYFVLQPNKTIFPVEPQQPVIVPNSPVPLTDTTKK